MGQETTFATLIGSRICHDLISPIGAINNGIELIEMGSTASSPEMTLISESVANASARIRYFRIAFGAAGDQTVGRPEIVSILDGIYTGTRLSVAWGPLDGQPRNLVRLAFLAVMCLETAMPYGGRIVVTREDDRITVTGFADKYKIDAALWALLDTGTNGSGLSPAQVQFGLLPLIAGDEGRALEVDTTGTPVTLGF